MRDLGVHMSNTFAFDYHISTLVKSAQKTSAWLLRTFLSRSKAVMKVLLQSILVPNCEYASTVWCPFTGKHINQIENIQCNFTSKILETTRYGKRT